MQADGSKETITAITTNDITIGNMFRTLLKNMALSLASGENFNMALGAVSSYGSLYIVASTSDYTARH
jgi:hypothetical protein